MQFLNQVSLSPVAMELSENTRVHSYLHSKYNEEETTLYSMWNGHDICIRLLLSSPSSTPNNIHKSQNVTLKKPLFTKNRRVFDCILI